MRGPLRMPSLLAAAGVAVILAGCAQGGGGTPTANPGANSSAASTAAGASGSVYSVAVQSGALGSFLVGEDGKSLYMLTKDSSGTSTCTGNCASNWPPFTLDSGETAVAGTGVSGTIGTISRPDGSTQVAINGQPLYYFKGDSAAGDTNGQGVNGTWFLVTPAGGPVGAAPSSAPSGGYSY
jgi:predicted lipoprotein with Yx(FWY)xxD motif